MFHRGSTIGYNNAGNFVTGSVHASVVASDLIFAFVAISDVTIGDPGVSGGISGTWNLLGGGAVDDGVCRTKLWWKQAVEGDAGTTITSTWTTSGKGGLILGTYGGTRVTDPVDDYDNQLELGAASTTHASGAVTPLSEGCYVIDFYAQRGTAAATMTAPGPNRTERIEQLGVGAGSVSQMMADSNGPVPANSASGPFNYTTDVSTANVVVHTVAIRTAGPYMKSMVHSVATMRASTW